MDLELLDPLIDVGYNRTVELRDALDTEVVCVRGCLWVIEDRPGRHRILRSGESHRVRSDGHARVTALEPSLMCALGSSRPARQASIERENGHACGRP